MRALLDTINGGPRESRADDARVGLWLAGLGAVCAGVLSLALHLAIAVPPGAAIVIFGLLGLVGFVGALVLEWRRGPGEDDDGGGPGPDEPTPEDGPVDWEPFERLLRDSAESREPAPA